METILFQQTLEKTTSSHLPFSSKAYLFSRRPSIIMQITRKAELDWTLHNQINWKQANSYRREWTECSKFTIMFRSLRNRHFPLHCQFHATSSFNLQNERNWGVIIRNTLKNTLSTKDSRGLWPEVAKAKQKEIKGLMDQGIWKDVSEMNFLQDANIMSWRWDWKFYVQSKSCCARPSHQRKSTISARLHNLEWRVHQANYVNWIFLQN